jgi:hypothetical protein
VVLVKEVSSSLLKTNWVGLDKHLLTDLWMKNQRKIWLDSFRVLSIKEVLDRNQLDRFQEVDLEVKEEVLCLNLIQII